MSSEEPTLSRRHLLTRAGALAAAAACSPTVPLWTAAAAAEPAQHAVWQQVSDRKIRLGVVGGGFGSAFPWHQHPNCVVQAVSDLQPARRDHLMKVFQCTQSYESLEQLVLDDKLDAVAVFTDAPSHGRHCVEVLKHGKHCISAVPAAFTLEDCERLKQAKEQTGLKYMMAETSYFHADVIRARNWYRQGLKLLYSEGQYYHDGVTAIGSWKNWRRALPPMFYPTHSSAYYVGVSGKRLTKVSCLGYRGQGAEWEQNPYDNNPFVSESAVFHTSEGTVFRCNVFWKCDVGGESGSFVWEQKPTAQVPDRVPLPPGMDYGGHGGSHGPLANEFVMALVADREPAVTVYEALAMTAPGLVAHQSALKQGELLTVPSFDRS